jgi:hypothetical protein
VDGLCIICKGLIKFTMRKSGVSDSGKPSQVLIIRRSHRAECEYNLAVPNTEGSSGWVRRILGMCSSDHGETELKDGGQMPLSLITFKLRICLLRLSDAHGS